LARLRFAANDEFTARGSFWVSIESVLAEHSGSFFAKGGEIVRVVAYPDTDKIVQVKFKDEWS
jgi:hypothetical protein